MSLSIYLPTVCAFVLCISGLLLQSNQSKHACRHHARKHFVLCTVAKVHATLFLYHGSPDVCLYFSKTQRHCSEILPTSRETRHVNNPGTFVAPMWRRKKYRYTHYFQALYHRCGPRGNGTRLKPILKPGTTEAATRKRSLQRKHRTHLAVTTFRESRKRKLRARAPCLAMESTNSMALTLYYTPHCGHIFPEELLLGFD